MFLTISENKSKNRWKIELPAGVYYKWDSIIKVKNIDILILYPCFMAAGHVWFQSRIFFDRLLVAFALPKSHPSTIVTKWPKNSAGLAFTNCSGKKEKENTCQPFIFWNICSVDFVVKDCQIRNFLRCQIYFLHQNRLTRRQYVAKFFKI